MTIPFTGTWEVTHADGTTTRSTVATARPAVEAERRWPGGIPLFEAQLFVAWWGAGQPGGDFDAWVDTVADIRRVDTGPDEDPSRPAAGGDS